MALRIVDQHAVYRDPLYYCGPGPSVVVGEGGEWLVAFRRVPSWLDYGYSGHWHPATESCLTRSTNEGATWSTPEVFLGGYQCPSLTQLRDGILVHSTHRMELVTREIWAACPDRAGVPGISGLRGEIAERPGATGLRVPLRRWPRGAGPAAVGGMRVHRRPERVHHPRERGGP